MYHLVPADEVAHNGLVQLQFGPDHWRTREGFQLTDAGTDLTGALDQAHYCIKCHNQGKDSCSHGLKEKDGSYKSSVFGVKLAGCPLDEKSWWAYSCSSAFISPSSPADEHSQPFLCGQSVCPIHRAPSARWVGSAAWVGGDSISYN
jgi:hypothetical protein